MFKSAEEHQGEFLALPGSMKGATGAHSAPKEQLRPGVPQEAFTGLGRGLIVWLQSTELGQHNPAGILCVIYYAIYYGI